jgi:hypothetical protein
MVGLGRALFVHFLSAFQARAASTKTFSGVFLHCEHPYCNGETLEKNLFPRSSLPDGHIVREGQFLHTSAEIEFPRQIFRGPRHLKPIIRCHVELFNKLT